MKSRDLSVEIADFFHDTSFAKLPHSAVDAAKMSIIDTLGVCLAASGQEPAVHAVIDLVRDMGGRGESTILGYEDRVPAMMAAFANGAMAHCLDYDDQTPWGQHAASSLVPAILAVSQRVGGVSGEKMICAMAAGQDFFNRFRRHVDWQKDWMFTTVIGVFGATAAAAYLLGLTRDQIANAIAISSMQCSGLAEVVNSNGSDLRALYAGFPAKGAVLSALMAERGISGLPEVFEGPFGVMKQYFGNRYDRDAIVAGLGEEYIGGLTLYKKWPTVGTAHSHIQATIGIMIDHDISPDDVAEVFIHVGDYHRVMCEPLAIRRAPRTLVDAKFSLPFLVALAAVHRDVRLGHFTNAGLVDSRVLKMAEKVVPVNDASLNWTLELPLGRVELTTTDGRRFGRTGARVPGGVDNPMTWNDILRKFEDCALAAASPWSAARIRSVGQMVTHLESLRDATQILSVPK